MMQKASIEWTDASWNPVRGCSRVSDGCRNCYAERQAARFIGSVKLKDFDEADLDEVVVRNLPFRGFAQRTKAGPRWTGRVELIPSKLDEPLRWRKPQRIFVNSMSDLFHENLSDEAIAAVFGVMSAAPWHTFQVLTKRPERMRMWFEWVTRELRSDPAMLLDDAISALGLSLGAMAAFYQRSRGALWPLPNVWLGVSVEDQATADERIPLLLQTPAAKRFVSYEPALGPVDFVPYLFVPVPYGAPSDLMPRNRSTFDPALDWIIVGGESGPGARPFDVAWARSTVQQCRAAGVACFVKQMGAHPRVIAGVEDISYLHGVHYKEDSIRLGEPATLDLRDRKGGDWNEWPEDLRVREFPA